MDPSSARSHVDREGVGAIGKPECRQIEPGHAGGVRLERASPGGVTRRVDQPFESIQARISLSITGSAAELTRRI